ncbi:MAG: molybdopterin-guanine dinucleotide biosynthesis protein B [Chloroflexi bacterium]|nr:molybdopterin-guanine dinucleotide biosynthesis protein B [Chloroflexota bacterium]
MTSTLAIVGPSGSGKTRVAVALVERLRARGHRVAAVKHSPHGHQVDRPASDSSRLFAAGADKVIVSSPGQSTAIERTQGDASLEEVVATLDPSYDLVIAEGFKGSTVPKVLVVGGEVLSPAPGNVIAVVGAGETGAQVPCYSFEELDRLADQVEKDLLEKAGESQAISLVVDGRPVPLGPFAASALAGVVHGFLSSLKGVPASPRWVRLGLGPDKPKARHL